MLRSSTTTGSPAAAHDDVLLTAIEAGAFFGVAPGTIRVWKKRGLLTEAGMRGRAKLYRFSALALAERTARTTTGYHTQRFARVRGGE